MGSLRFPFSFPQPPKQPNKAYSFRFFSPSIAAAAAAAAAVGLATGLAISLKSTDQRDPFPQKPWQSTSPIFASLSLADSSSMTSIEPKTGAAFPIVLDGTRRLLGVGLRKKSIMGLKSINVYAFGVYAEDGDVKKLSEKYGDVSASELGGNKEFFADVMNGDVRMTVRLQIVYGRLSIRSVRSAFEESVGSRIQKFSGSKNEELLQRFTSLFKDEYKLPRGSIIDLSREQGHILLTKIDGKEVGSIQSKLLCQSILDLYIGEDPFDRRAKEDVEHNLAFLLQS